MITHKIKELVKDTVNTLDYILVECTYKYGRQNNTLKVVIYHHEHDISTKDCEKVSRVLSSRLDVENLIPNSYNLIVESPGVDRKLSNSEEFRLFKGKEIRVILRNPNKYKMKDNVIIGVISDYQKESLFLKTENRIIRIEQEDIARANLHFEMKKYL